MYKRQVPITLIVLILCFTSAPVPTDVLLAFLVGAVLLIVGMGLFTLGADTAMLPIGERVGAQKMCIRDSRIGGQIKTPCGLRLLL